MQSRRNINRNRLVVLLCSCIAISTTLRVSHISCLTHQWPFEICLLTVLPMYPRSLSFACELCYGVPDLRTDTHTHGCATPWPLPTWELSGRSGDAHWRRWTVPLLALLTCCFKGLFRWLVCLATAGGWSDWFNRLCWCAISSIRFDRVRHLRVYDSLLQHRWTSQVYFFVPCERDTPPTSLMDDVFLLKVGVGSSHIALIAFVSLVVCSC